MGNRFKKVMSATDILVVAFGAMIGGGWAVLGIVFYITCRKHYGADLGRVEI